MAVHALPLALVLAAAVIIITPATATTTAWHIKGDAQAAVPEMVGSCHNGSVCSVLGIPFARAPLGALRWRPPQPITQSTEWPLDRDGVFHSNAAPNSCPQTDSMYSPQSEDCLLLNVFSPATPSSPALPVLVFFYGGSFTGGGISLFLYQAEQLAAQNVVVVTINYRLGALGWLNHPQLDQEDPAYPTSGNYGLMDQNFGLQWVQKNIARFGGDRSQVTVHGESAGAISMCFQMVMSQSMGLFQRAIIQSGSCLQGTTGANAVWSKAVIVAASNELLIKAACQSITCLRAVPATQLVSLAPTGWGPINDGWLITDSPYKLFQAGKYNHGVALLAGSNTDEGTMFANLTANDAAYRFALNVSFGGVIATQAYALYPSSAFATPGQAWARCFGDMFFTCPTRRLLRVVIVPGTTAFASYSYQWAHLLSWVVCPGIWCKYKDYGVYHSSELFSVFGHPAPLSAFTADESRLSLAIIKAWASFVSTGRPSDSWPAITPTSDVYQVLNTTFPWSTVTNYRQSLCDFWDSVVS